MSKRITVKVKQKEYVVRKPLSPFFWRPAQVIELLTHNLETTYVFDTDAVPVDIAKPFAWGMEFTGQNQDDFCQRIVSCLNFVGAKFEISTQRGRIKRVLIVERTV